MTETIIRTTRKKGQPTHGKTDWEALRKMKEPIIDEENPSIPFAAFLKAQIKGHIYK